MANYRYYSLHFTESHNEYLHLMILQKNRVGPRQGLNPQFEDCRAELYQFRHMALLIQIIVIALN